MLQKNNRKFTVFQKAFQNYAVLFLHLSNGKCTQLGIYTSNKMSIQGKTGLKEIPLYIFPDNISLLIVSSDAKDALFTEGSFKD